MSCGAIDYCLTILKSLLEYWRQISPDEVRIKGGGGGGGEDGGGGREGSFISSSTALGLMSCGAIDYCLTILKSLLEYWRQISPDEVRSKGGPT